MHQNAIQSNLWSKADFLDRARELKRRLEVWQIDDSGPVWRPKGVEFLRALESSFRDSVLHGEHDAGLTFGRPIKLIPYSNNGSVQVDGFAITKPEQSVATAIESEPVGAQKPSELASVVEGVVRAGIANVINLAAW